jgi:hypothetical protein
MKDLIKEQRLIEATKKHYMGPDGRIGTIVRNLGSPIRSQSSLYHDVSYIEETDDYYQNDNEDLPTMDEDGVYTTLGIIFDGLNRGMHIEIRYFEHTLSVLWKGYKVFEEEKGDLLCFIPREDWEKCIEKLYVLASKLDKIARKEKKNQEAEKIKARKQSWLKDMMNKWGIDF